MKSSLVTILLAGSLTLSGLVSWAEGNPGAAVPDNYIIQLQPGANPAAVAARHGVAPKFMYDAAINGFAGFVPPGILRQLQADPEVTMIVPDREVTAIGKPTGGGTTTGQVLPLGVKRVTGGNLYDGSGVGIAIIDTGIDLASAHLNVAGASFSAFSATAQDDNGHGTHVSGIAAAMNNSIGVVGVAAGATVYAVKVLDRSGSGSDASIIAGLNWVAQQVAAGQPIKVANMSLGRPGTAGDNQSLHDAINAVIDKGVIVVVAAGNDCGTTVAAQIPAAYDEVLAVASTTAGQGSSAYKGFPGIPADTASYFTTDGLIGGRQVDVSAPGEDQENVSRAGFLSSVGILSLKVGGGTTRMSGTSMASPHVAGIAALYAKANPAALAATIKSGIIGSGNADGWGSMPRDGVTTCYSFDGAREGIAVAY